MNCLETTAFVFSAVGQAPKHRRPVTTKMQYVLSRPTSHLATNASFAFGIRATDFRLQDLHEETSRVASCSFRLAHAPLTTCAWLHFATWHSALFCSNLSSAHHPTYR